MEKLCGTNCDYCPIEALEQIKSRKAWLIENGKKYPTGHGAWHVTKSIELAAITRAVKFDLDFWMTEDPTTAQAECYMGTWLMGVVRWEETNP